MPGEGQADLDDIEGLKDRCRVLLKKNNAVLIAHYYVDPHLQDLADETGGCVSDSLEMARFGREHAADTLVVAGVRFMAETAKILSFHKRVLTLSREATCSLDEGCSPDEFQAFCDQHKGHTVVSYTNTSARVKALSDWTVTSSIALPVIQYLNEQKKKILFAPDWHLGHNLSLRTGVKMVLWRSFCVVHDEFQATQLRKMKEDHPGIQILVHPESSSGVMSLADCVGSTSQLLRFARESSAETFVVATDEGLLHKMRRQNPNKSFIVCPTSNANRPCTVCGHCPWMAMNSLRLLERALEEGSPEILLDHDIAERAALPIERMLSFGRDIGLIGR